MSKRQVSYVTYGSAEFQRRYVVASRALDSAARMVALARKVERTRVDDATQGIALVNGKMLQTSRRVGLLATSMNPLSQAHLALARAARQSAGLDAVCWIATQTTIDKEDVQRASLVDRLAQAGSAARALGDGLALLKGGLYVEQARAAKALLAHDVEVALIVGYDKIVQIFDSRYYADRDAALRELFNEAEVIVAPRGGASDDDLRTLLARPENRAFASRVRYAPLAPRYQADSSSEARALAVSHVHRAALRRLLAPEGLALATVTGAYDVARLPTEHQLGDRYTARLTLLDSLMFVSPAMLHTIPSLRALVEMSEVADARGAALRRWISEPSPRDGERLLAALRTS